MKTTKQILIINDGKTGHFNQSIGILKALEKIYNLNSEILEIKIKNSFSKRVLKLLLNFKLFRFFFKREENLRYINVFYNGFKNIKKPNIIISSGKDTTFLNAWLSLTYNAQNIFSGNPRGVNEKLFNIILTVIDLKLSNQIIINVAPSIVSKEDLLKKSKLFLKENNLNIDNQYFSLLIGGNSSSYDKSGTIVKQTTYSNDTLNGKWVILYPTGQIEEEREYSIGKIVGLVAQYYKNGNLKYKMDYSDGKKHGYASWYFANGEVSDYGNYKNDLPDGEFYSYHPNGLIKREAIYLDGELKSEILYNENGEKVEL